MSRLGNLRRGAAAAGGGGKGKGKGGFFAKWTPPSFENLSKQMTPAESRTPYQAAEPMVLVQGEYPDLYTLNPTTHQPSVGQMYHHHSHRYQRFFKGKAAGYRSATCTRGPDQHNPQPCVPCLLIDQKVMDEKGSGARSSWVVNGVHLTSYYEDQYIKDGQAQTKQDGSPIMIRKECRQGTIGQRNYWNYRAQKSNGKESAQCEGCAKGIPHQLGSHRYWELGKGHLNALLDFNEKELAGTCYYTNTGIVRQGFVCSHCRTPLVDIAASGMTNEQIQQFEDAPQTCPSCQTVGLPDNHYESGYDAHGISKIPGHQPPVDAAGNLIPVRPLDLFDVVIWVQREGEGTKSVPVIKQWERLTQAPFGENGAPFDLTGVIESLASAPFDFAELFSTDPSAQAKEMDVANPYAQQQQQAPGGYPPPSQGAYAPSVPPPPPPQPGYAPQAQPTAAPGIPAGYAPPAAAPAAAPYAPPAPAAAPYAPPSAVPAGYPAAPGFAPPGPPQASVAPPGVGHVPAPYAPPVAAPPAAYAQPAPTAGPLATAPAAPPIAVPYPQAPGAVPAAPIAGGPPQPGNRPGYNQ